MPADNPFVGVAGVRPEIWSYRPAQSLALLVRPRHRRPDRSPTSGRAPGRRSTSPRRPVAGRGVNFGWACREGTHVAGPGGCAGSFADPTFWYANDARHLRGHRRLRRPRPRPEELVGRYVYADLCAGSRALARAGQPARDRPLGGPHASRSSTTFGEDRCGRVYVASRNGPVSRLVDGTPAFCPPPDRTAPDLALDAKRKQKIDRRRSRGAEGRLRRVGQARPHRDRHEGRRREGAVRARVAGRRARGGKPAKLELKLRRRQARRCRRLIDDGKRVEVQIGGVATDVAGNPSPAPRPRFGRRRTSPRASTAPFLDFAP